MPDLQIITGNYRYSSWSMRGWLAVRHAVDHSDLKSETIYLPLRTSDFAEQIKRYSPSGKVPALNHGTINVWDSLAIIDYLARITPNAYWWPDAPAAYALARSVASEMHSGFFHIRHHMPMNLGRTYQVGAFAESVQTEIDRVLDIWKECRTRFGITATDRPGPFLFGAFSAADIMFAPMVSRFLTYGVKTGPVGKAYMANVNSYKAVDDWYLLVQHEKERLPDYEFPDQIPLIG